MRFSLTKKGIRYQQVIGQREIQNILPFLTPATIPKTPVHPLEPYISRTHMAVEISSYEEFLADRHGTDHTIQIFLELSLGALTKAYLRGIGTNHIHNRISNYHTDQDNLVASPSNLYNSILKAPIVQDTDTIPTRCCPRVPKLESSTLNLLRLLALPFSLLNT